MGASWMPGFAEPLRDDNALTSNVASDPSVTGERSIDEHREVEAVFWSVDAYDCLGDSLSRSR